MEIKKKSRTELKTYFVKNALPTVGNFSDLIDAGLNQKDDGIAKSADQPVQIAASPDGDKPAIQLYESFATDAKPAWVLSLQADGKKGLGIGDGDGKNRLFIDGATGGVGIGTADPGSYKLRVVGSVLVNDTDGKANLSFGSTNRQMLNLNTEAHGIGVQSSTTYFRSSSNFAFYKGGVHADSELNPGTGGAAMLVIKNGNVGIGTADPGDYKLNVAGAVACGNSDIYFTNTTHDHSGRGNTAGYAAIENAKNYDALMILGRSGTDKGRKVKLWDYLEVIGTFANSSDARKKRDIEPLHYGLAEVKQLRPVSFNWISIPNQHKSVGLVAQEVREVIHEVVYEDDGLLSISYQNLVAVLINAIKDLDRKVEALSPLKEMP